MIILAVKAANDSSEMCLLCLWLKAGHMPGEAEIIDFPTSSDAFHEGQSRCATLWLLSCLVFPYAEFKCNLAYAEHHLP